MVKKMLPLLIFLLSTTAFSQPHAIKQKPILFNAKRIALTREYRRKHYGIHSKSIIIQPKMIVLHWTDTKTLAQAFRFFYPPKLRGRSDIDKAGKLNVSAHFLVARNGDIYQLMPTNWMARHVIGLNNVAIGIENVGGATGKDNLTQKQLNADVYLIHYLVKRYPSIQYLIGHFEYLNFKGSTLWQEKDPAYQTKKVDPGLHFMQKVRAKVKGLRLRALPA